jgi:hypothetical protein
MDGIKADYDDEWIIAGRENDWILLGKLIARFCVQTQLFNLIKIIRELHGLSGIISLSASK